MKNSFKNKIYYHIINGIILSTVCALTSCSVNDEQIKEDNQQKIRVKAELASSSLIYGRAEEKDINRSSFYENDSIGIFINKGNLNKWTYCDSNWESEEDIYWPDKTSSHEFHAFYPHTSVCSFGCIPLPSLHEQDGTLENLFSYDFLVTKVSSSYDESNGTVSFTKDNGFKHILSLLKLNIIAEGELIDATIDTIILKSENIFSKLNYSFEKEEVTVNTEGKKDELKIFTNYKMNENDDVTYYIIANPISGKQEILFTLKYKTDDNKEKIKSKCLTDSTLQSGSLYEYNIRIKDGNILIDNPIIKEWNKGNKVDDIYI